MGGGSAATSLHYRRGIRVLHTSDSDLAALLRTPFAAETLTDPGGLVVLTVPDNEVPDNDVVARLSSLPCLVIAVDRSPDEAPPLADVAVERGIASVEDILAVVERNPLAAISLVLCLREAPVSLERALVAESAVYSLLQAGAEFKAWRRSRPIRERRLEAGPTVRIERNGDSLELVLNRPHVRNALNRAMRDELLEGLVLAAADSSVTKVIVRGEGENFCSGGDLDEFGSFSNPASAHILRLITSIGRAIDGLGSRIVVEVHGPCVGSGVELAAFAARVIARSDFTAALPEVRLGLIPGAGGTASITRRVGRHRMALLALSGSRIDATTALRWGLVDEVVPL